MHGPGTVSVGVPAHPGNRDPTSSAMQTVSSVPNHPQAPLSSSQCSVDVPIRSGPSMPFMCTVDREDSYEDELGNEPQESFSFAAISTQLTGMLTSIWKSRISPEPTSAMIEKHQQKNAAHSGNTKDSASRNSPHHKRTGSQPLSATMTTTNTHRGPHQPPGRHIRRGSSSSVLSLDDVVQPKFNTPDLLACLRVQDILVPGQELDWNLGQCLDVFVHPASLPDLYHELQFSSESSCIVQLTAVGTAPDVSKNSNSTGIPEDSSEAVVNPAGSFGFGRNSSLSSGRSSSLGSNIADPMTSGQSSQISSPIPGMDISSMFQQELQWKEENVLQPPFVTARLCFASSLKLQRQFHWDDRFQGCAVEEVLPGHVVLSDVLKMRLQVGSNGRVLLNKVVDQWRVIYPFNATFKHISITPLSEVNK